MKYRICTLLFVLVVAILCCNVFADEIKTGTEPGQIMPDFTVSLTDGSEATLSELLKENDLVVLNIFASWCKPCESEFPEMEKTYKAHNDRMVILSVSDYTDDTMDVIAEYKDSHSLTFPMGLAEGALDFLNISGYPTTCFITDNGKIAFKKVGAFSVEGDFEKKVNTILSDNYDGNPLPKDISAVNPEKLLILFALSIILLIIGRWRILRKAGKHGWHSLVPILSTYQEYAICWNGWVGVLSVLFLLGCIALLFVNSKSNWIVVGSGTFFAVYFVLRILESIKLSKSFGKSVMAGVLMVIFHSVGRFILGINKAEYQG